MHLRNGKTYDRDFSIDPLTVTDFNKDYLLMFDDYNNYFIVGRCEKVCYYKYVAKDIGYVNAYKEARIKFNELGSSLKFIEIYSGSDSEEDQNRILINLLKQNKIDFAI